jgi:hypothetical protein
MPGKRFRLEFAGTARPLLLKGCTPFCPREPWCRFLDAPFRPKSFQ